jgi:hypothetical protein
MFIERQVNYWQSKEKYVIQVVLDKAAASE